MIPATLVQLSPRARTILSEVARSGAPGREVRRAQALLWLDGGESIQTVAIRLQVSRQMLYDLIARYEARSELSVVARIQDEAHCGRPATKRLLVKDTLEALLQSSPTAYGYRGQLWTIGMLKTQIERQHELRLSDDTVQRAVHELDYRYKRPRFVLARRAPFWRQAKGGSKTG
jgi:transposase